MDLIAILRSMIVHKTMKGGTFNQTVSKRHSEHFLFIYMLSISSLASDEFLEGRYHTIYVFPVFCDYMKRETFFEFGPRTMCLR